MGSAGGIHGAGKGAWEIRMDQFELILRAVGGNISLAVSVMQTAMLTGCEWQELILKKRSVEDG